MAQLVYLAGRRGATRSYTDKDIQKIANTITPDNAPSTTEIIRTNDTVICVINPPNEVLTTDRSICMGQQFPVKEDWDILGVSPPDGSYAIVRGNKNSIELISDATASRTLFYSTIGDLFIAATSQRAIAHFMDDFTLNHVASAWMISSGSLGPPRTWNRQIQTLPADSILRVDRSNWETDLEHQELQFNSAHQGSKSQLKESLDNVFSSLNLDFDDWILPLSGGLDSRELLLRLQNKDDLSTITWGAKDAQYDPKNDAYLAAKLANSCDVKHDFYPIPSNLTNPEVVFERFLTAGEGRVDKIAGYLDGLDLWSQLAEEGYNGVIRGDEGFGWVSVANAAHVRRSAGAFTIEDFKELPKIQIPGASSQSIPAQYRQRQEESLSMWRDRLYQTYRIPTVLAALSDIKLPYLEVCNPFLSRRILETVRSFSDEARTNKQLYSKYVLSRSPDIPVAKRSAVPNSEKALKSSTTANHLQSNLDTSRARNILGNGLVDYTLDNLEYGEDEGRKSFSLINSLKQEVGDQLPRDLAVKIASHLPVSLPKKSLRPNRLAFRLYIINRMDEKFKEDVDRL